MGNAGDLARENEALRQRLSRLSEAGLRINESLDFGTVLQDVVDSARALTGARHGVSPSWTMRGGGPVALTATEYRMPVELSANSGRALTHQHLLHRVWGPDKGEDSGPVRHIVRRLRRKLGDDPDDPSYIFAEPSVGYRMAEGGANGNGTARNSMSRRKDGICPWQPGWLPGSGNSWRPSPG